MRRISVIDRIFEIYIFDEKKSRIWPKFWWFLVKIYFVLLDGYYKKNQFRAHKKVILDKFWGIGSPSGRSRRLRLSKFFDSGQRRSGPFYRFGLSSKLLLSARRWCTWHRDADRSGRWLFMIFRKFTFLHAELEMVCPVTRVSVYKRKPKNDPFLV